MLASWLSFAFASDTTLELLSQLTVRDGIRVDPYTLDAMIEAGCAADEPIACSLRGIGGARADRAAIGSALKSLCDGDNAIACLGRAWAEMPLSGSAVDPTRASDPDLVFSLVESSCDAGLLRACTELGSLYSLGIGTYVGRQRAEALWVDACDEGEARACSLLGRSISNRSYIEEGIAAGDVAGWTFLAELYPQERQENLMRACDAGETGSCVLLAEAALRRSPESLSAPRQRLGSACRLGDPVACAWGLRIDASIGVLSRAAAAEAMGRYCAASGALSLVPWACEQAWFLEHASKKPLFDLHLVYPGQTSSAREFNRLIFDRRDQIDRCANQWLARDPSAMGTIDLVLQIESDGLVNGVYVARAEDTAHGQCVAAALDGADLPAPTGGVTRLEATLPVYHKADVQFRSLFPGDGTYDVLRVTLDTPAWSVAADRCLLSTVGPESGTEMELRFQALRDGTAQSITVSESSETQALDDCMIDWLTTHQLIEPVKLPVAIAAKIRFLKYQSTPTVVAPLVKSVPPLDPAEVTPVRVLVLRVSRSTIAGKPALLSKKAKQSIAEAHEELARRVRAYTHDALSLQTTIRDVNANMAGLNRIGDEFSAERWSFSASQLPALLRSPIAQAIEPGQWDAVFIWVPTTGEPQPAVGAQSDSTTLQGATITVLPVPGNRALQSLHGLPPWELPLRGLWRQTLARADRLLGVELPSDTVELPLVEPVQDRSERQVLGGQAGIVFDPRSWNDPPSHSVLSWYTEVLGFRVHPRLWRDVWLPRATVEPNLAQLARPSGEGVLYIEGINDTLIDFGRYLNVPIGDPDAETIAFGLEWRSPVRIETVIAHTGSRSDPARPSFRAPVLEVLGPDLRDWAPVDTKPSTDGATIRFSVAPMEVYGVRVRITDGAANPALRELEVN